MILGIALWSSPLATAFAAAKVQDPLGDFLDREKVTLAFQKFGRGTCNLLLSWVEIGTSIEEESQATRPVAGFTAGLLRGLFKTAARAGVGVYEMATFCIPIPADFRPVLPPLPYFQAKQRPVLRPTP